MSEKYEVKNIDEVKNLSIDEIKNFNMNMLKKEANLGELCGTSLDDGSSVRVGGNPEVEMLIVRKELGIKDGDELTPDAETILNQLKMIDVCEELDKYEYGINNLKELGKGGKLNKVKPETKATPTTQSPKATSTTQSSNETPTAQSPKATPATQSPNEPSTDEEEGETPNQSSSTSSKIFIVLIIIISLIILSFVIYFFVFRKKNKSVSKNTSLGIF